MSRCVRYLVPLLLLLLLAGLLYRGLSLDPKVVPSPLIGKPMPVQAARTVYRKLAEEARASNFDPATQLQWLIDSETDFVESLGTGGIDFFKIRNGEHNVPVVLSGRGKD